MNAIKYQLETVFEVTERLVKLGYGREDVFFEIETDSDKYHGIWITAYGIVDGKYTTLDNHHTMFSEGHKEWWEDDKQQILNVVADWEEKYGVRK